MVHRYAPKVLRMAADIIDAKGFRLAHDATDDEVEAAALVFDHGLLMTSSQTARDETAAYLRTKAAEFEADKP